MSSSLLSALSSTPLMGRDEFGGLLFAGGIRRSPYLGEHLVSSEIARDQQFFEPAVLNLSPGLSSSSSSSMRAVGVDRGSNRSSTFSRSSFLLPSGKNPMESAPPPRRQREFITARTNPLVGEKIEQILIKSPSTSKCNRSTKLLSRRTSFGPWDVVDTNVDGRNVWPIKCGADAVGDEKREVLLEKEGDFAGAPKNNGDEGPPPPPGAAKDPTLVDYPPWTADLAEAAAMDVRREFAFGGKKGFRRPKGLGKATVVDMSADQGGAEAKILSESEAEIRR